MQEMVDARRTSEKKDERYDLLSSLLDANEDGLDGQSKLTDRELLGMSSFAYVWHLVLKPNQGIFSFSYWLVSKVGIAFIVQIMYFLQVMRQVCWSGY